MSTTTPFGLTRLRADALLLTTAVLWGIAFAFQKQAMEHVAPLQFIATRSTLAVLALAPLSWWEGRTIKPSGGQGSLALFSAGASCLFFLGAACQQIGIVTTTATNAGFLTGLYIVLIPIMGYVALKQPVSPVTLAAVVMAFFGLWMLGGGQVGGFTQGDIIVGVGAIFWSAHLLVSAAAQRFSRPITFTALQFGCLAILGAVGAWLFEDIQPQNLWAARGPILYVGLVSSALTFTVMSVALAHTPPTEAAVLLSLETVFAAIAGALVLGERLSLVSTLGAALMFAAMLLVQLGPMLEARWRG